MNEWETHWKSMESYQMRSVNKCLEASTHSLLLFFLHRFRIILELYIFRIITVINILITLFIIKTLL